MKQTIPIPGLTQCTLCPRLVACRESVAHKPAKGFSPSDYWSRPVPGFGDPNARLLIIGLAPGAHGANRSGRPFTGDAAGIWLYPTLHAYGFSTKETSVAVDDGLQLKDAYITNAARCVPPGNRPTPAEVANCAPYLDTELAHLKKLTVIIPLGTVAQRSYLLWARQQGYIKKLTEHPFVHGAEYILPNGHHLLPSYHCSRLNTNTGRLTRPMFDAVFARAREILR